MSTLDVRSTSRRTVPRSVRAVGWDQLSIAALAILVGLVVLTFGDYGVSNDEEVQHRYGAKLIAFYLSGFRDRSALSFENLYLYGGLFDMAANVIERALPVFDPYDTRHLLSGLVGVGGIAAAWRLARLLAGPRAGFLALALLALTAPWYGAMFNHTKDIPFAVAMAWQLHFSCRCMRELPCPGARTLAGLALASGAALGLRVGGLLGFVYLGGALSVWAVATARTRGLAQALADARGLAWRLALVATAAYAMMAFFWPWSVEAPLNPIRALVAFTHFKYEIDTLFAGQVVKMYDVPAIYAPVYFAIRLPLVVLAGTVLAAGFGIVRLARLRTTGLDSGRELALLLVALAAVFPLVYSVVARPYLYSGLRHFYFAVPPLVVLAGLGFDRLIAGAAARRKTLAAGALAGLGGIGFALAAEMVQLHPQQYVSYNLLVGGLPGAVGRWATDYWTNIAPEAVAGIVELVKAERRASGQARRIVRISICGARKSIEQVLPPGFAYSEKWDQSDFFVSSTHIGCDRSFPAAPVVHSVRRLGVTLGVVRDLRKIRRDRIEAARSIGP
ncbi:MAG: hypothetical protein HY521_02835 [Proteobacteria bacterium]|nr:hypothetical protein [Pseudomonadota bacterium]